MSTDSLADLAHNLSSLDHALLLSLIAKQHCLIETTRDTINDVAQEIQLIATQLFGLSWALLDCHHDTSLEKFSRSILIATEDEENRSSQAGLQNPSNQRQSSSYSIPKPQSSADYTIANIIIAKNLDAASRQVQIQVLELIRTHRIFTHTAVHAVPKPFLLVVLTPADGQPLNIHLNDIIFLSHYHDPLDDLPRLESMQEHLSSLPSRPVPMARQPPAAEEAEKSPKLPAASLLHLSSLLPSIDLTSEIRSYLMTITISLRTHRVLIPGSATPLATRYLELLSRCLALLHGLHFISPSIVALAAKKVYRHRLRMLRPSDAGFERSVMYGSRVADVKALLEGLWSEDDGGVRTEGEVAEGIIEGVIAGVEVPV